MEKILVPGSDVYSPQTLFLYGTYKEDGTPNFGLFCWAGYCWDGEVGFMACIHGTKLTKDRIRKAKVFSANLVSQALLPLADYLGNTRGYEQEKASIPIAVEQGRVLNVPVLADSPVVLELEVSKTVSLEESEVYFCKIRGVLQAAETGTDTTSPHERMRAIAAVRYSFREYFSWDGKLLGSEGALQHTLPGGNV